MKNTDVDDLKLSARSRSYANVLWFQVAMHYVLAVRAGTKSVRQNRAQRGKDVYRKDVLGGCCGEWRAPRLGHHELAVRHPVVYLLVHECKRRKQLN